MASVMLFASEAVPADPYDATAEELARVASVSSKHRVAVLPFLSISGPDPPGGLALAERLTARLSSRKGLVVVERTLLERVLSEQGLEVHGLVDARQVHQVGRVLGVDSVVTGTFFPLSDGKLEVNARLIDTETARILGVVSMRADKDWRESSPELAFDFNVAPPDFGLSFGPSDADALEPQALRGASEMRDALAGTRGCKGWQERLDGIQSGALELDARRWAARLRSPAFAASRLTDPPGAHLRSATLRQEFFKRVRELYEAGYRKELSAPESALLGDSEREAAELRARCAVSGD